MQFKTSYAREQLQEKIPLFFSFFFVPVSQLHRGLGALGVLWQSGNRYEARQLKRLFNRFPTTVRAQNGLPLLITVLFLFLLVSVLPAGADNPPVIDLNGPGAGIDYSTTFVEDNGPVPLAATVLMITADGDFLESATVRLEANPDKAQEIIDLSASTEGTQITKSYNAQKGILRLEGHETVAVYEALLQSVTYQNLSDAPDISDRHVTFRVSDASSTGEPASTEVAISAVNDAPILDNSGDMHLESIDEDDQEQIGNDVASIIASAETTGVDRITDPDLTDPEGIAVIEVGDGNGTWQFSTDAGASWQAFGVVSNGSAVLLRPADRIRFLPDANYSGQASVVFRAWDQTTEATGGARADASVNGGSAAFSTATESASVDVLIVDDPPFVDLNGALPGEAFKASFLSTGAAVSLTTPDAVVGDVDNGSIVSLVVTLTNRPDGLNESLIATVQKSIISASAYDPESGQLRFEGPAALEEYSAILRGLRYLNEASSVTPDDRIIEFIANDGANNSPTRQTTLTPKLENMAPVLTSTAAMRFADIIEDASELPGESVSALLASAVSDPIQDPDVGDPKGFAVVGAENDNGMWQFSVDAGVNWLEVGQVSESSALLLSEAALLRFVPDANFSGAARSIVVRAWDHSQGANGLKGSDTTVSGGVSAFSTATATIPIFIEPVNDAPVLTITENTVAAFIEGNGPVVVAGPALQIADVDSEELQSAVVRVENVPANEPDLLKANLELSGISTTYDEVSGTLSLSGNGSLADYQAILRAITFDNLSQDPDTSERHITFQVNDGSDTSNIVAGNVTVEAVNDPPVLDLNGELEGGIDNVIYYDDDDDDAEPPMLLAEKLQIHDVDNTTLIEAVVNLAARPDGVNESLVVNTEGTNITAAYLDNQSKIELTGQDSLSAYQQVLRTLTYSNSKSYANRALREIAVSISDADSGRSQATATVVVRPQFAFFPFLSLNPTALPLVEEPNDSCEEALSISINELYEFQADDVNDWFHFSTANRGRITVELTEFAPEEGQLLVAEGTCGALKRVGHNGDFSTDKSIDLGTLNAGEYYIWLINDGPTDLGTPYRLRVTSE